MQFWVNHLSRSIFERESTPITTCDDNVVWSKIQKIADGYAMLNNNGAETARVVFDCKVREISLHIYTDGKKWIALERPQAILWHVYVQPEPEIVAINRGFLAKSYHADFRDGWTLSARWKVLSRKYRIAISQEAQIDKGLAFAVAMDLAMQTYTIELS